MKQNYPGQFIYHQKPSGIRFRDPADWDQYHKKSDEKMTYNSVEARIGEPIEIEKDLKHTELETTKDLNKLALKGIEKETLDQHVGRLESYFGTTGKRIEKKINAIGAGQYNAKEVMQDLGNPKYKDLIDEVSKDMFDSEFQANMDLLGSNNAIQSELAAKSVSWDLHTAMGIGFLAATTFVYARSFEGRDNEIKGNLIAAAGVTLVATNFLGYGPHVNGKPAVRNVLESAGRLSYETVTHLGGAGFEFMKMIGGKSDKTLGENLKSTAEKFMNAATEPWGKSWDFNTERLGENPEQIFWKRVELFSTKGPAQTRDFFAFVADHHQKKIEDLSETEQSELHTAMKGAISFMLETEVNREQLQKKSDKDPEWREKDILRQTREALDMAISSDPTLFRQATLELISQKNANPQMEDLEWDQSVKKTFDEKLGKAISEELMGEYKQVLQKDSRNHTTIIKPSAGPLGGLNGVELLAGSVMGIGFLSKLATSMVRMFRGEGPIGSRAKKVLDKIKKKEPEAQKTPSGGKWNPNSKLRNTLRIGTKKGNVDSPQPTEINTVIDQMQKTGAIDAKQATKLKAIYTNPERQKTFWKNMAENAKDPKFPDDKKKKLKETNAHQLMNEKTKKGAANKLFAILNASETSGNSERAEIGDLQAENDTFWALQDRSQEIRNELRKEKPGIKTLNFELKTPLSSGEKIITVEKVTPHKVKRSGDMSINGEIHGKARKTQIREIEGIPHIKYKNTAGSTSAWLELEEIQYS